MSDSAALRFQRICSAQIAAGNTAWVQQQLQAALENIAAGSGELITLQSGQANGKNFAGEIQLTPLEIAEHAQAALDAAAGKGSGPFGFTTPSFGGGVPNSLAGQLFPELWPFLSL